MKPTKKNIIRNLLERFSCSIVKRGKKVSGHKILLKSLLLLRDKNRKTSQTIALLLPQNKLNKTKQNIFSSLPMQNSGSCISFADARLDPSFEPLSLSTVHHQKSQFKSSTGLASSKLMRFIKIKTNPGSPLNHKDFLLSSIPFSHNKENKLSPCISFSDAQLFSQKEKQKENTQQETISSTTKSFRSSLCSPAPNKYSKNKKIIPFIEKSNQTCQRCVENVKVVLETRKVRKGRVSHRVPIITNSRRQEGKATILLIKNGAENRLSLFAKRNESKANGGLPFDGCLSFSQKLIKNQILSANKFSWFCDTVLYSQKKNIFYGIKDGLAEEFFNSGNLKGISVENKKQLHSFALQNRASLHLRWW